MPSNTQPTSIVTSAPQASVPRMSMRAGIGERHAGVEQRVGLRALVEPLELGQLAHRVDAERLDDARRRATSRSRTPSFRASAMTSVR